MKHDAECENGTTVKAWNLTKPRVGCRCAERAYALDPYPGQPLPGRIPLHDTPTNSGQERAVILQPETDH